ncbi:MAG: cell division/cell wall cluster transcriptional repressor MraZ [Acidimicrobiia bacterium]|nr:cell division/cell wall cluster transcriptional repressor MraZ [Acidimicrobiia bacterium]
MFVGTHERSLDEKGRMALPVSFRSQLGERGYLVDLDGCLGIYAEDGFRDTVDRLSDRVRTGDASQDSLRVFSASVHDLKVDSQGRVVLPAPHRAKVAIDREVVVIGAINRIEIYQPTTWDQIQASSDGDDRRVGSWI